MRAAAVLVLFLVSLAANAERDDHQFGFNNNHNESYAQGGEATSTTGGVSVAGANHNDDSSFFAFATTFPQAHGCMGGVQGGGAGSSSGGFFGIHFINENCWTSALAEAEANIEVKALLKCHGSVFQAAIAFEQKKKKQRYCVDFMIEKYRAQIALAREKVSEAIDTGALTPTTQDLVIAANISKEEFEEAQQRVEDKNAQQQNQINELERRAKEAERRAAAAEAALQKIQRQETSKTQALQQLQQQIRADYELPSAPPAE